MRIASRVALVVVAMLTLAGPASAGTATAPEIVDDCGAQIRSDNDSLTAQPGHIDICAGWFETTASGVKVTLQSATSHEAPEASGGGFWAVSWGSDGCRFEVQVDDTETAEMPQSLNVGCGPAPEPDCTPPGLALQCDDNGYRRRFLLPDSSVVRSGNTLAVTVNFVGELAEFAGAHQSGDVLHDPDVWAATTVGPLYLYTLSCGFVDDSTYCYDVGGDRAHNGRDYTVGT